MRFLFLVQGEGRGHMTQAMVLYDILMKNGHEVVHTFIGSSNRREIPNYFFEHIKSTVEPIRSPNFILDKKNKGLSLWKSVAWNALLLSSFWKSLQRIHCVVKATRPDVVVNFNELLGGFYFGLFSASTLKHVCVGRQFLALHQSYPFVAGRHLEKRLYLTSIALTSQKCDKFLALSFRPYFPAKVKNVVVMPPLLKAEVRSAITETQDFILAYMVNDGYAEELMAWHSLNNATKVHCFWDRKNMPDIYSPHENLTFHQPDSLLFSTMLSKCRGFVSSAGFESVCEAMYLGKPVMMIPVDSQYEQACNALEACQSGAGILAESFNVSLLLDYLDSFKTNDSFQVWADEAETRFIEELTNL